MSTFVFDYVYFNLFKPFVFMDENFHPVCKPGRRGLCALRFSAAAFLFARALRLPSRNCWAAPGLLEEELEEEEESSSSLELSFQQEIVVVSYEVQRFPARKGNDASQDK